jgi:predicted nucleic acid-binding protein
MERYKHTVGELAAYQALLANVAEAVVNLPTLHVVPLDPKDDVIVETAVRAAADYLVTGDRRHLLVLGAHAGIQIVTPRQFLELLDAE